MSVILSDKEYEAVIKALLNAHHDLSFFHGLHVTDLDDVRIAWDIDCSDAVKNIDAALSVFDKFDCNRKHDCF